MENHVKKYCVHSRVCYEYVHNSNMNTLCFSTQSPEILKDLSQR